MLHLYGQPKCVGPMPLLEPARVFPDSPVARPLWLAGETALVTMGAITAIALLNVRHTLNIGWFAIPTLLVAAALVPTWIGKRQFPPIGLDTKNAGFALGTLCQACIYALPVVFLGLWLVTTLNLPIPLQPIIARQQNWFTWLLYQFLYVAVGEELFFRGYVQANIAKLLDQRRWGSRAARQWLCIVISAACFALAHVVVQGRALPLVTFFPGLLLAWLFARTRSLLAPILFHGLANVTYGIMALTLA